MTRRSRNECWFTNQVNRFGFQPQGQGTTAQASQNQYQSIKFFAFTQPYVLFKSFQMQQIGPTPPPVSGGFQYLIHGPDITEQFVTGGGISAMGVSYPFNPLSRRTV